MSGRRPNILFVFADQLRAASLPLYGERQIRTPHLDRLAAEGVTFTQAISSCPLCTPYRSMLVTGRHPQTTGHVINHLRTRHDEISIGDAFARAGYATGWVGKWHLHTGTFPSNNGPDYVPEGRDRLGFDFWRGYNFHMDYFDGFVHLKDWHVEPWKGYETNGLNRYAMEFMDANRDRPFCLFVSPHQPHWTDKTFAPESYYRRLPERLSLPANVPEAIRKESLDAYRHYLAMTLALDDMMGDLLEYLVRTGLAENTMLVFTSDHGSQMGAHGEDPWEKMLPYEESLKVPMIVRWPGRFDGGRTCDTLTAPVDFFPTLCSLCGVPIPRTVEGLDLSDAWLGRAGAREPEAVFTMNFVAGWPGYLQNGAEWRGVRTKRHSYARWLNGRTLLYDLEADPLEMRNLAEEPSAGGLREGMEKRLQAFLAERHDAFLPCEDYAPWLDAHRRIVRNGFGPLPHPDSEPDWSGLKPQ